MNGFASPQATWNQRFATDAYIFGEAPNAYLQSRRADLQPGSALAVADGEGRNGVWLAEQGLQVHAFDFSEHAIAKAHKLADKRKTSLTLSCSAWQDFAWAEQAFDNVVAIFIQFAPPQERAQLFALMDRALKPGGTLIVQGYSHEQLQYNTGGPGKLEHLYEETLLRQSFTAYDILDLRTYTQEIAEGTAHKGLSGLIGMSARKRQE